MSRLKAAIVGCGAIFSIHEAALSENNLADITAVCDIVEEAAKEKAKKLNCSYYTKFEKMLANERIDVIHICTPHYLHAPMAIAALESNCHVFIEKPVAISSIEAMKIAQKAEETGKLVGVSAKSL